MIVRLESDQAEPAPVYEILRNGLRDSGAVRAEGHVVHRIVLVSFHITHTGVFASSAAWSKLIGLLGFQCDPKPLNPARIACRIELDPRDADPRKVAFTDEPREEIKIPVVSPRNRGIQNPLDLVGISGLGSHQDAHALQIE
jgi:hypothetical protein